MVQISALERKNFPKHESMVDILEKESKKKNTTLYYMRERESNKVLAYIILQGNYISKLLVESSSRKRGIGSALLEKVIQKCKDMKFDSISLHVGRLYLYIPVEYSLFPSIQYYYSFIIFIITI